MAMNEKCGVASLYLYRVIATLATAVLGVVAVTWMAISAPRANAAGDPIVVIVNKENPVENLSMGDLKKLYLSDRSRWDTGKAVAPVILPAGTPERTSFLKQVCGMSDTEMSKYFLQAAFTGKAATPPKEVGSAGGVIAFVAGSPGGIGFVKAGDLPAGSAVKAVKVEGAAASDPGYKLKM
jgi:ABC-type phosphate transport system substrate-binding protein